MVETSAALIGFQSAVGALPTVNHAGVMSTLVTPGIAKSASASASPESAAPEGGAV